ncbi:hypothetical protein [Ornithinimicrobium kibberense]|uniref:hypothetical protein n=1 Tax=Ornithinimicrobium kibberense TaxID=282060 RepID=UPI00361A8CAB
MRQQDQSGRHLGHRGVGRGAGRQEDQVGHGAQPSRAGHRARPARTACGRMGACLPCLRAARGSRRRRTWPGPCPRWPGCWPWPRPCPRRC